MKKILLLIVCVAMFAGCGNNTAQQQAKQTADSLSSVKQQQEYKQQRIADSISMSKKLALAKKAYGNADFEMPMSEVKKMAEFKNWYKYENYISVSSEKIGLCNYQISLSWYEDKLYYVNVTSDYGLYQSATYLDTDIKEEVINFKEIISKTYGEPTTTYGFPNIFDFTAGRITWAYRWDIETKVILIGVIERSTGSEYQMNAWIYNKPLYEKRVKEIENNREKIKSEDIGKF